MNDSLSKISIITVTYNAISTIEQTMLSVLNQNYDNIEYIIIDGASTDGTVDSIKRYDEKVREGEYPNVIFRWISEPDKGIYDAMNKGIMMTTGEWVGIINSGDYYEPFILEKIIREAYRQPDIDLFFGNMKIIREGKYFRDEIFNGSINLKIMNICHPTVFIRKNIYIQYGIFDEKFRIAADYDLLLRFYKRNIKFKYLDTFIASFATGGVSSVFTLKILRERYQIRIKNHIFPFSLKEIATYFYCKLPYSKKNW